MSAYGGKDAMRLKDAASSSFDCFNIDLKERPDDTGSSIDLQGDAAWSDSQATAGESVHAVSPLKSSGRNGYNEQHCHCNCPLRAGTRRSSVAGDSDHRFQAN